MAKVVAVVLVLMAVLSSCVSTPAQDPALSTAQETTSASASSGTSGSSSQSTATTAPATSVASQDDADIDALIAKARSSIDSNHLSEGIKFYISALAKATKAGKRSRVDEINGTLTAIGARLTVEPHESWLEADGSQKTGSSRAASRGEGLMPAVYLYESYGFAKSAVPDAFIRFEFISNEGNLNASVTTDSKGLANTSITSMASPGKDGVVRAFPVFTAEGYSYAYKTVFRDFSYIAPPNLALVAVMERTPAGESPNPRVLDSVASSLKPLGVEVVPYNGVLKSASFNAAFGGDIKGLSALAGSVKAGYFALVNVDVAAPVRMEYQGKVYNIFIANAKATLRIVRADGTIVFAEAKDGVKGQGGTEQAAIDDCLVKVRDALSEIVKVKSETIKKAFSE